MTAVTDNGLYVIYALTYDLVHGWPLLSAPVSAVSLGGSLCHHVERGVSRFIPSILVRSFNATTEGEKGSISEIPAKTGGCAFQQLKYAYFYKK